MPRPIVTLQETRDRTASGRLIQNGTFNRSANGSQLFEHVPEKLLPVKAHERVPSVEDAPSEGTPSPTRSDTSPSNVRALFEHRPSNNLSRSSSA